MKKQQNYSKEQKQLIKNFKDTTSGSEQQAINYLVRTKWNIQNAINVFFDQGAIPEKEELQSTSKIQSLFNKLSNESKTNKNIRYMDEQMFWQFNQQYLKFTEDNITLGYILINIMKVQTSGYIEYKHFLNLFQYLKVTDPRDLLGYTKQLENQIKSDRFAYSQLYKKIYKFYLIGNKNISLQFGLAEELWKIYLKPIMHLYNQFMEYIRVKTLKPTRVHKDLWNMVYDFAISVNDISSVSEMDGWPVFLDEFVEYCKQNS